MQSPHRAHCVGCWGRPLASRVQLSDSRALGPVSARPRCPPPPEPRSQPGTEGWPSTLTPILSQQSAVGHLVPPGRDRL